MQQIQIGNLLLPHIVFKTQTVITLDMVDKVHVRKTGTAKRAFVRNRLRFEDGVDFHQITKENQHVFIQYGISVPESGLIALTESGYLMIVKTLKDNMAWQIQKMIGVNYFTSCRYIAAISKNETPRVKEVNITREVEAQVKALIAHGVKPSKISKSLGISFSAVSLLAHGKYLFSAKERERQPLKPNGFFNVLLTQAPEASSKNSESIQHLAWAAEDDAAGDHEAASRNRAAAAALGGA